MTTLENRPNTALLVIDMQNNAVERAHDRDAVIANVADLVDRARREGVPVVWVQHSDDQLVRLGVVRGQLGDDLPAVTSPLRPRYPALVSGDWVVVGAQTDWCVRSTLHGALARGYDAILVSNAHTTEDQTAWGAPPPDKVIAHTNMYWANQTAPGRTAGIISSNDVDFGGPS